MQRHWNHMDQEVKAWRMPRRYRNFKVKVSDCVTDALVATATLVMATNRSVT